MTHYIIDGGPFDVACRELLDSGFRINWHDRLVFQSVGPNGDPDDTPTPPQKKDRVKFTCTKCGLNAWAKPSALITCTVCNRQMVVAIQSPTQMTTSK